MLCPLPGASVLKAGAAAFPFPGIELGLYDPASGKEIPFTKGGKETTGLLAIKRPWPGLARTILNDHARYLEVRKEQVGLAEDTED